MNLRQHFGVLWRKLFPGFAETIDIGRYAKQWCLPTPLYNGDTHAPAGMIGSIGIDLHIDSQLARVRSWSDKRYQDLFTELRQDGRFNTAEKNRDTCIVNGFYPTPDAECYAAMILDSNPDQIVEIGSGYSTRIARRAIQYAGLDTTLRIIDPQPRADISKDADEIILKRVEETDITVLGLTGRSVLFIDSSHISRARGDVAFLYSQVIPGVPQGTIIHIHDVYLPYDYPTLYDKWLWNEQYLLSCLLSFSEKFEVLLTTHLLSRQYTDVMRDVISPQVSPDTNRHCGGCYWLRSVV